MVRAARVALAALLLIAPDAAAQDAAPSRVASLVPAATEALFAIGAGPLVVGVGDYDDYPPAVESLPRIGGLIDPNLEAILALRPELVIVDPSQRSLVAQLDAAGIDTYSFKTGSIDELLRDVRALGVMLQAPGAEPVAAEVERAIVAVRDAVADRSRPTTLVVFGRRPGAFAELWVSGGEGFLHDVVEVAGGVNAFADVARQSFKSGLEAVLARRPEVVIEALPPEADPASVEAEWRALPGFGDVRVIALEAAWTLRPSPRVTRLLWDVAAGLHPDLER